MARNDVMIKDAPLVQELNGSEKIPLSDGSNRPKAVNIEQIKEFIGVADVDLTNYPTKQEVENSLSTKIESETVASTEPTAEFPQVLYVPQALSEEQKAQARKNIGVEEPSYDDSKIKEELIKLENNKADKSQLTELSAKVGDLEEEGKPIFKAIYGETTYEEIKAAYDSGKVVHSDHKTYCYILARINDGGAYFSALNSTNSHRLVCSKASVWSEVVKLLEIESNKVTSLSDKSTDTQYPSAKAVYDALQNVGGGGVSTPSGDPMHYMFEDIGAEWNGTGADIERQGIFGDTIVHKAGYWWLNELGDITTEELRYMYSTRYISVYISNYSQGYFARHPSKTIISNILTSASLSLNNICQSSQIVNALLNRNTYSIGISSFSSAFIYCNQLEKILNELQFSSSVGSAFDYTYKLREVRIKGLKNDLAFKHSTNLSNASILHAIKNEAATTSITITLHATAYERAMADAEITAALAAHPNVSLAKA